MDNTATATATYHIPDSFEERTNYFTELALIHCLKEENWLDNTIKKVISQTDDEAKCIYLIADNIKAEITHVTPIENIDDDFYQDALDYIYYVEIDHFEIAKEIYNQYNSKVKKAA